MKPKVRLIPKDRPDACYATDQDDFLIGRAKECAVVLEDQTVSRQQARIRFEDGKYNVYNLGKNPLYVNDQEVDRAHPLKEGDLIAFGETELVFHADQEEDVASEDLTVDGGTILFQPAQRKVSGPRLVVTGPRGESSVFPIDKAQLMIGRKEGADVLLQDSSVSRRHCMIEEREEGFFARNISQTNPLLLEGKLISETRLYSGNQLGIGSFTLSFLSDRPEDAQPETAKVVTQVKKIGWPVWLIVPFILLPVAGYLLYSHLYLPWKVDGAIEDASKEIAMGSHDSAQASLKGLLQTDLPADKAQKAARLLTQSVLERAKKLVEGKKLPEAIQYLASFLRAYGRDAETEVAWERLDSLYLKSGQLYESREERENALRAYAAVREEGPYFEEAQKGVQRIWALNQKGLLKKEKEIEKLKAQLLEEAKQHFLNKRFTSPTFGNAYSTCQSILAIDPNNADALDMIEGMKAFYLERGGESYQKGDWRNALSYFQRYRIIDPDASDVKEKVRICREKIRTTRPAPGAIEPSGDKGKGQ